MNGRDDPPGPPPPAPPPPADASADAPFVRGTPGQQPVNVARAADVTVFFQRFPGDDHAGPEADRAIANIPWSYRRIIVVPPAVAAPPANTPPANTPPANTPPANTPAPVQTREQEDATGSTGADGGVNLATQPCPAPDSGVPGPNALWIFRRAAAAAGAAQTSPPPDPFVVRMGICADTSTVLPPEDQRHAQLADTVAWLVERLGMLGYGGGLPADQSPALERALLDFQWDHGLPVTGRADNATFDALRAATEPPRRAR